MYSQFCYYIQKDEEKRRATMHIPRKPGEQIEVDWAGDPAHIIDPDTGEITEAWIFVGVLTYSQYAFVKAYTVYRNDKLNDASNPAKLRYGINTKGNSTGSLEQKEWNSDTVEIDFTEKVILEHCKVQLDIETGAGQCRLA